MDRIALIADRVWDGVADAPESSLAVVIDRAVITQVVPVGSLDRTLPRRELPGCTLIPGLIDAHVHYSGALGKAFLAAGVTTIRDVGNDMEWILARRSAHAIDPTLGPAIVCCGHLHDGPSANWPHMGRAHTDAPALVASIQHHVERGVDQIKLYAGLDLEMLRAAVTESHRLGKFVLAHLGKVKAHEAVTTGLDEFEHLDRCDVAWGPATEEQDDVMIDLLLHHNVVIDPTLVVWDRLGRILERSFHHDERRQWVHPCHRDIWNRYLTRFQAPAGRLQYQAGIPHLKRFLRRAHSRGVVVALGTDTPFPHLVPGFSVHDELAMYVDAGLRPVDALRCATSVNAKVLGISERAGRIAPGVPADLVAVSGNPLERIDDISGVMTVWRAGQEQDPANLLAETRENFAHAPDDPVTHDLLDYVNGVRDKGR